MSNDDRAEARRGAWPSWMTRGVIGIVLGTFFSDVGHEMVTAVLPIYLVSLDLGPAALGVMEGAADFAFSVSKLLGGFLGHHVQRKRPLAALGYGMTALATAAVALVSSASGGRDAQSRRMDWSWISLSFWESALAGQHRRIVTWRSSTHSWIGAGWRSGPGMSGRCWFSLPGVGSTQGGPLLQDVLCRVCPKRQPPFRVLALAGARPW